MKLSRKILLSLGSGFGFIGLGAVHIAFIIPALRNTEPLDQYVGYIFLTGIISFILAGFFYWLDSKKVRKAIKKFIKKTRHFGVHKLK